jgi:hypothetical protein
MAPPPGSACTSACAPRRWRGAGGGGARGGHPLPLGEGAAQGGTRAPGGRAPGPGLPAGDRRAPRHPRGDEGVGGRAGGAGAGACGGGALVADRARGRARRQVPWHALPAELPSLPFRQLLEVRPRSAGLVGLGQTPGPTCRWGRRRSSRGPSRSPSLVSQLEKELASADRVDWLVSFIKWSGIRALKDALTRFVESEPAGSGAASGAPGAAGAAGPRLRIATTSYLGATDLKAIRVPGRTPPDRGAGLVRHASHAAPRQGLPLPPPDGVRERVRGVGQRVAGRAGRGARVDRQDLGARAPLALASAGGIVCLALGG